MCEFPIVVVYQTVFTEMFNTHNVLTIYFTYKYMFIKKIKGIYFLNTLNGVIMLLIKYYQILFVD